MEKLQIDLLRPHWKALSVGFLAVIGETIADLLQPWPLKIVFDNVLKSQSLHGHGWLNHVVLSFAGTDRLAVLRFAAIAALAIAIAGAICSYTEKYLTTSIGQWVMHDLRLMLYFLTYSACITMRITTISETGDLIGHEFTNDIDAVQSFIAWTSRWTDQLISLW